MMNGVSKVDEVRYGQKDVPGVNPPPARSEPLPPRLVSRVSVDYERVPGVPEVPDGWGAEAWPPTPPSTPPLTVADVEGALRRVLAERALDDEQRRQQSVRRAEQERREIAAQLDAVRAALPVDRPTGQGVDLAAEVAYVVRERDNARTALRESLRMQRREGDDLRAAAVTYLDGMMQVAVQRDRLVAGVLAVAAELERLAGGESAGVGMVVGLVASWLRALVEARPLAGLASPLVQDHGPGGVLRTSGQSGLSGGVLEPSPLDSGGSVMSDEMRARWERTVAETVAVIRDLGINAADIAPIDLRDLGINAADIAPINLGSIQPPTDSPQQTDKEGQES